MNYRIGFRIRDEHRRQAREATKQREAAKKTHVVVSAASRTQKIDAKERA